MEAIIKPNSKTGGYILTGICLLLVVGLVYIVWKVWFQFKDSLVKKYIDIEVSKYAGDQQITARKIITEGCHNILMSRSLTKQVTDTASDSGTERELELVHAAVKQATVYGYLEAHP